MLGTLLDIDIAKARVEELQREAEQVRLAKSLHRSGTATSLKQAACRIDFLSETRLCTVPS